MNNHKNYILLKKIVNEVDPIGLIDFDIPESLNEYDPELKEILREDITSLSYQDLSCKIHEIFIQFFNKEIAGPKNAYNLITKRFISELNSKNK